MARVAIPLTDLAVGGTDPTASTVSSDATNDHNCPVGDDVFLEIVSSDASSQDVTIRTPGTVDGVAVEEQVVSVPAGARRLVPMSREAFAQPTGTHKGDALVDVPVDTLTLAAFRV